MKYSADRLSPDTTYYMYPDVMTDKQIGVSVKSLKNTVAETISPFLQRAYGQIGIR